MPTFKDLCEAIAGLNASDYANNKTAIDDRCVEFDDDPETFIKTYDMTDKQAIALAYADRTNMVRNTSGLHRDTRAWWISGWKEPDGRTKGKRTMECINAEARRPSYPDPEAEIFSVSQSTISRSRAETVTVFGQGLLSSDAEVVLTKAGVKIASARAENFGGTWRCRKCDATIDLRSATGIAVGDELDVEFSMHVAAKNGTFGPVIVTPLFGIVAMSVTA